MVGLLDVNVLVALFDPDHGHHDQAHEWFGFADHARSGWVTSSVTQNGLVRIISHPSYPGRRTHLTDAVDKLWHNTPAQFCPLPAISAKPAAKNSGLECGHPVRPQC